MTVNTPALELKFGVSSGVAVKSAPVETAEFKRS